MAPLEKLAAFPPTRRAFSLFEEFKNFALKGNVIDLAVGVIIGAAFGGVVKSLVDDISGRWPILRIEVEQPEHLCGPRNDPGRAVPHPAARVAQPLGLGQRGLAPLQRLLGPSAVFVGKLGKLRSLECRGQEGAPHGDVARTRVCATGLDRAAEGEDSPVA